MEEGDDGLGESVVERAEVKDERVEVGKEKGLKEMKRVKRL